MLDKIFITRKLKLIQEDLARLEPMSTLSFDKFSYYSVEYDATERLLERIVTRAIDINRHIITELGTGIEHIRTYHDTFLVLADIGVYEKKFAEEIAPSAGLRNILVHEYDSVDAKLIYNSVKDALSQYAQYCDFILGFISTY